MPDECPRRSTLQNVEIHGAVGNHVHRATTLKRNCATEANIVFLPSIRRLSNFTTRLDSSFELERRWRALWFGLQIAVGNFGVRRN